MIVIRRSTKGKTCLTFTLPTTNPTRNGSEYNAALRGDRLEIGRLIYGQA